MGDYIFSQEKIITRQNETKVTLAEWNAIWMMHGAKQRKGIESFQLLQLRDVLKTERNEMQKEFVSNYRELKIESNRGRQTTPVNTLMMRKQSLSKQRYHDQRIKRDSKGRDFYQERRSIDDSRGRPFHRKYYRRNNERHRSFSRDMRSRSRRNLPDKRDGRSGSRGRKNDKKQDSRCTGCTCDDCKQLRETAKEFNVNWCKEYKENEGVQEKGSEQSNQIMILDLGAPVSVSGKIWMEEYLEKHGMTLQELNQVRCYQRMTFGPSRQYISRLKVELPVPVQDVNGKEDTLKVHTYIVEADVSFLCGKSELQDKWKSKINTESNILEVKMNGQRKEFRMIATAGNHVALKIGKEDLINDEYNRSDKCSNQHENKNDLENHKERKKKNGDEIVCNLCEGKFGNRRELRDHGETEHKNVTYICIHVYCGNRYMCKEKWREHMRKKHEIGHYCELCNEYCLFKDDLEEHMESHVTEIACEEDLEEH